MIPEAERQQLAKAIGDYLLKGYTMLNESCPDCSSVMMRRKDEESFCVYCRDIKKVVPKVEESAPEENHKSCEEHKFFGVISEERLKEIDAGVDHVLKICSQQLVNLKPLDRLTSHWAGNSCTTGPENSHQDIQKCLSTIEQAVKLHQLIFKQRK